MKIIFDAAGGDDLKEIILGAVESAKKFGFDYSLYGEKKYIQEVLKSESIEDEIEIIDCTDIISNDEDPAMAIRKKKDSSIVKAMTDLKLGKADAFISAGSTGALLAGGIFIVGRIKGYKRAVLPTTQPGLKKFTVIDSGANVDVDPELILEFAKLGNTYLKEHLKIENPKIALLNIGAEKGKGNELSKKSYELLESSELNFVGNIEARDLPKAMADLIVCDGFVGNVFLKTVEGFSEFFLSMLKHQIENSELKMETKLEISKLIKKNFSSLDAKEVGGTILLGVNSIVVKAHGNSNKKAIINAAKYACDIYNEKLIEKLGEGVNIER